VTDSQVQTPAQTERPEEEEESLWEAATAGAETGETPDSATRDLLGLVHQAIDRFPELAGRYRRFAGPAAVVSGALIVLAGIAVARRVRQGEHPEHILEELTSAEIESAAQVAHQEHRRSHPRPWRRLRPAQPSRRKKEPQDQEAPAASE